MNIRPQKIKTKAFTLVELLVVIAIIGLLATLSVIALNSARAKSRDAKRVADVKQISTALELFFNDAGRYPTDLEWASGSLEYNGQTYLSIIPSAPTPADGSCDSTTNQFSYTQTENGASYTVSFCVGGATGSLNTVGEKCLLPGGISEAACVCTPDCNGKTCGDDGCGGSCGTCTGNDLCLNNNCFNPGGTLNLLAWYDASGLVDNTNNSYGTVSGGVITNWKDLSGNSRHLTGSYGYGNALLSPSLSYFNNHPGVVFSVASMKDKSDYAVQHAISAPLTIIMAYHQQNTAAVANCLVFLSNYNGGTGWMTMQFNSVSNSIVLGTLGSTNITAVTPSTPFSTIVTGIIDGTNSKIYLNGSPAASGSLNNHTAVYTVLGMDGWWQWLDGEIAEVLIYDAALSDSDRQAAEAYLNNKYNIY